MQIKEKYSWAKHLDFLLVDLCSLLLSILLAYFIKFRTISMNLEWNRLIVIVTLLNIVIYFVGNPYSGIFHRRYYKEIGRAFIVVMSNALCAVMIFYVFKIGAQYSREVIIYTYTFYFFISVVLKYVWKKLMTSGWLKSYKAEKTSLFLISNKENVEKDIHSVYATDLPLFNIKGVYLVSGDAENDSSINYKANKKSIVIPVVKDQIVDFILNNGVSEVLVCVSPDELDKKMCSSLIANGVGINLVVESILSLQTEEQFVTHIGVSKVLNIGSFAFSPSQQFYLMIKRLFDITCGLIGLVLLGPIALVIKFAYLLSGDTARIIYRQDRIGLNGKKIRIWKFRSMAPNADTILRDMLEDEHFRKEWSENQKIENDPRITRIGKFLRKTSIDELPQLINVLIGDMSLVGPRPLVEGELVAHNGLKLYEKVKPGITGWWGCNGRSNINYKERLELEYYYVKNCSLYLDFICIIRTIYSVLKNDGAQ